MRAIVAVVILIAAVVSAYSETRSHGFVDFDDPMYVTGCVQVQQGLTIEGVRWAFTNLDAMNWHPVTWLSHMLDYELFGLNAGMHHLVNVGFHAINSLLVLACMCLLTRAFWPSVAIALIWAVHPLRVESVAWIAERKDLLSAMFGLLCIIAYVWYARWPTLRRWLAVFASLALGLMAKPMLVTWPCLLLVLDIWPLRRWEGMSQGVTGSRDANANPREPIGRLIAEKLPMFAFVALSAMLTVQAQHSGDAMRDTAEVSIGSRVLNALVAYQVYIVDLFWPSNLAVLYPLPKSHSVAMIGWSVGLIVAISIAAIVLRRRTPWLLVGWLWYLGTLVPVIGLVQVGVQFTADRYTYLPHLGLLLALVMPMAAMLGRRDWLLAAVAVALSIPLWLATRAQVRVWKDSTTLYTHALNVTADNWMLVNNLGVQAFMREDFATAQMHFHEALRIKPDMAIAHSNLGELYVRIGDTTQALEHLNEAVRLNPKILAARASLAWLLLTSPNQLRRDVPRAMSLAEQLCAEADEHSPRYPLYLDILGAAQAASGQFDQAIATASRALELADPRRDPGIYERIQRHLGLYRQRRAPA